MFLVTRFICVFASILSFSTLFLITEAGAQSSFVSLNPDFYHLTDRYEIMRGQHAFSHFSTVKAYSRKAVAAFADSLLADSSLNKIDRFNLEYIANDSWEWSKRHTAKSKKKFLKTFYPYKGDFFHTRNQHFGSTVDKGMDNFDVHFSPILYFGAGKELGDKTLMINGRGAEVRGTIADRLGFYASVVETQMVAPSYVRERTDSLSPLPETPVVFGEAFAKQSGKDKKGYDFLTARGYFTFRFSKMINFQFGHDRHFLGNGYRSMMLSDFSAPYLFMKINTKIGRFHYTNLYTQLISEVRRANQAYPKKYMTMHHLSINLTKNINIGFWEAVVFARSDGYTNDTFVLGYLNPIMFYRSVEQNYGSEDNALLGMDFKINAFKTMQFYGQFVLDEFVLSEIRTGKGWSNNKQAVQLGVKYINAFKVKNLDLQAEFNYARPFMYQHSLTPVHTNYAHYAQALAHPVGGNFREVISIIRWQPLKKWTFTSKTFLINTGTDVDGGNWGGNIMSDVVKPVQEFGNTTGQGVATRILFTDFTTSFQFRQNVFFDLKFIHRNLNSANENFNRKSNIIQLAFRMNIAQKVFEF
jgi:hypothetical protein